MECGLHLDNRIGHKQFNRAIANIPLVGTATVIHKKCEDVNAVLCRALSHLPPEADAELLTCTYALKYNAQANKIDELKISNVRLQIVMQEDCYRRVVEIVYAGHENAETKISEEIQVNRLYLQMMRKLRQTKTFSEQELIQLQDDIDAYCDKYCEMSGNQEITNYLHTLQTGHVRHHIRRFGNLFRFANVGFEAYIGTIRRYLMRRTQNGGHGGVTGIKVGHAHQACRLAKRVSVGMNAAISSKDNQQYYDDVLSVGKKQRLEDSHTVAEVPVEEGDT